MFQIGDKVTTNKTLLGSQVTTIGVVVEITQNHYKVKFDNFYWLLLKEDINKIY